MSYDSVSAMSMSLLYYEAFKRWDSYLLLNSLPLSLAEALALTVL